MSVQKTSRLEIRLTDKLKKAVDSFCADSDIDITFYVTSLIRANLKKAGYLPIDEKNKQHLWTGDIDDMPACLDNDRRWKVALI